MNGHKLWDDQERQIIRKYHPDIGRISKLLPHRTRCAIMAQCRQLGFVRPLHLWNTLELTRLRKLYPSAPHAEICAAFPHSSWMNIAAVARYHGFRRDRNPTRKPGCQRWMVCLKNALKLAGTCPISMKKAARGAISSR